MDVMLCTCRTCCICVFHVSTRYLQGFLVLYFFYFLLSLLSLLSLYLHSIFFCFLYSSSLLYRPADSEVTTDINITAEPMLALHPAFWSPLSDRQTLFLVQCTYTYYFLLMLSIGISTVGNTGYNVTNNDICVHQL